MSKLRVALLATQVVVSLASAAMKSKTLGPRLEAAIRPSSATTWFGAELPHMSPAQRRARTAVANLLQDLR